MLSKHIDAPEVLGRLNVLLNAFYDKCAARENFDSNHFGLRILHDAYHGRPFFQLPRNPALIDKILKIMLRDGSEIVDDQIQNEEKLYW